MTVAVSIRCDGGAINHGFLCESAEATPIVRNRYE